MSSARRPSRLFMKFTLLLAVIAVALVSIVGWKVYAKTRATMPEIQEYPVGPLPAGLTFDRLEVQKSRHLLIAYNKNQPVRVYRVALGNPVGPKQFQGDCKTPGGLYSINDKNPNSDYHKNLGISYPNDMDRSRARKLGKDPGGDIKIHGLAPHFASVGVAHRLTDWTWGCIAVTNPEVEELYARVPLGTPIEIKP